MSSSVIEVAFYKVLAPYLFVVAGFAAGRLLGTRKEELAKLVIYMITPVVMFTGVMKADLTAQYLLLPVIFFILCTLFCLAAKAAAVRRFSSPLPNILGFASGNANSGYFAIPVGMALFGDGALSTIILCSFGFVLYEHTVGFYVTARGRHSPAEALAKVFRLPAVYAFLIGLAVNWLGFTLSGPMLELTNNVRGAYSVIGMMIIGLGVADLKDWRIDFGFTAYACFWKHLAWPIVVGLLLAGESAYAGFFAPDARQIIFLMATLPLAANTVAVAAILNVEPERAAVAVLTSTLLALALVPLTNAVFGF